MPKSKTVSDLENRAAFLVQLRAFLLRAKQIATSTSRGKGSDILVAIDAWLVEVGDVGQPRPSIMRSPLLSPQTPLDSAAETAGDASSASGGASSAAPQGSPPASSSRADGTVSSFTVDMMSGSGRCSATGLLSCFNTRNLEDLAEFLAALFVGGIPESARLQALGRNVAHLAIVRCFSIIANTLQQVVRAVYTGPSVSVENPRQLFLHFARDIDICAEAVLKCMQFLTASTDAASARFATQVCVDVLKQLRQCVVQFKQRIVREELNRKRTSDSAASSSSSSSSSSSAAAKQSGAESSALSRVSELRALLGPALLASVERLMSLVSPAVRHLVGAVSARKSPDERAPPADASGNLFALAEWVTPAARWRQSRRAAFDASFAERDKDAAGAEPPLWDPAAQAVSEALPGEFSPEYIACVAEHCGDQSDGSLVAVRIVNDAVSRLDADSMRLILSRAEWRRRLTGGILKCLLAMQPAVLGAGLATLQRLVTGCPESLGTEIGFLYTSGVFRLLESDNALVETKRTLLRHVVDTFFSPGGRPPLLLRLYEHFDLNVRWHQLNVVQQAVATLSKAVRGAAAGDFADAPASPLNNQSNGSDENFDHAAPEELSQPLPLIALHGLTLVAELLAAQAPPDGLPGGEVARLSFREAKLKEQRAVDVINSAPLKGLRNLFQVSDAEMCPADGAAAAENGWVHTCIPPAADATKAKARRVAAFLLETPSLNPESVAEFLSHPAVFPLQVCQEFMAALPLAGRFIIDGLRELFSYVQSPKEGQRVERLLEFFCSAYYRANAPEATQEIFPFATENACFIVGVAVLMLNTNLHNPHVSSAKMTADSFYQQLRGCNNGGDFDKHFTTLIFDEIRTHSLSGVKGIWSAGMGSGVRYASVSIPNKVDSIFFSSEERRELAFGVECQSLASETRELVARRSRIRAVQQRLPHFWCAAAQDLFLSIWPSLCAVFDVAVLSAQVPSEALVLCARGLRSSLVMAAAFGLETQCDVSLLALLRMSSLEPMRVVCFGCVLEVAASPHSANFSVRCWSAVAELIVDIRRRSLPALLVLEESLFARMEEFTQKHRHFQENGDVASDTVDSSPTNNALKGVNILEGGGDSESINNNIHIHNAESNASECNSGLEDGENPRGDTDSPKPCNSVCTGVDRTPTGTSAGRVSGGKGVHSASGVSRAVRHLLKGITAVVADKSLDGPALAAALHVMRRALGYSLIQHNGPLNSEHGNGDIVVHHVNASDFSTFVLPTLVDVAEARSVKGDACLGVLFENVVDVIATIWETPPSPAIVNCCTFFTRCFDRAPAGSALRMHVLKGVAELMVRTVATQPPRVRDDDEETLHTIAEVWRRILCPLARAVSKRDCVGSETCSLAVHILRKLVVLCCGVSGGGGALQIRPRLRSIALLLLSHVAHLGAMCSEPDSAQSCLAQISTICTTALHSDPMKDFIPIKVSETVHEDSDVLRSLVSSVLRESDVLVRITLQQLCHTLRAQASQTRADAVSALRTLSAQLSAPQFCALASSLSDAVAEAALGRAAAASAQSEDAALSSAAVFALSSSSALRRCTPLAFRSTLPLALSFISGDLLSGAPEAALAPAAFAVVRRCLVPLVVSPRAGAGQTRTIAARSLMHAATFAATRATKCARLAVDAVALVIAATHVPVRAIVPLGAEHAGDAWVSKREKAVEIYADRAAAALQRFAEPAERSGIAGAGASVTNCNSSCTSSSDIATDDQLVDYCTLMAQVLSPLPKVFTAAAAAAKTKKKTEAHREAQGGTSDALHAHTADAAKERESAAEAAAAEISITARSSCRSSANMTDAEETRDKSESVHDAARNKEETVKIKPFNGKNEAHDPYLIEDDNDMDDSAEWAPPRASHEILAALLLEAAGTFFAILWRVNHVVEMESFLARSVQKGREVQGKSVALLPHAAVRGCLNAHLAVVLFGGLPYVSESRGVVAEVLRVAAVVQSAALTARDAQKTAEGAAESAALDRLSPQEQQHIRSCNVGMYQELAAVLAHWVRTVAQETDAAASTLSAARREELRAVAADSEVFTGMVRLLAPHAGSVIATVRDYFAWYIIARESENRQQSPEPAPLPGVVEEAVNRSEQAE